MHAAGDGSKEAAWGESAQATGWWVVGGGLGAWAVAGRRVEGGRRRVGCGEPGLLVEAAHVVATARPGDAAARAIIHCEKVGVRRL